MSPITTSKVKCRDCYKCLRSCPVKAISIKSGENKTELYAEVIKEKCIHDGRCVLTCPQKAKIPRDETARVKELLSSGVNIAASVAPSFAGALPLADPGLLPAALKRLGFTLVQETAVGAEMVSNEQKEKAARGSTISSACPVIINLVERYYPSLITYLSPLVSPMIAHARLLKLQNPGIKVVFIGPCLAKIGEAISTDPTGAVDFAIGFNHLWDWLQDENLDLEKLTPSDFDGYRPNHARLFPLEGGELYASTRGADMMDKDILAVSGLENCIEIMDSLSDEKKPGQLPKFIEMLACSGGCLNGPMTLTGQNLLTGRHRLIKYYTSNKPDKDAKLPVFTEDVLSKLLYRQYEDRKLPLPNPDEETMKSILGQTGKLRPEDELNCGACGYGSCREKATAVFHGYAEPQMCIPYMRTRAESMSNLVLHTTPNGIIVVDNNLTVLELNPAAESIFRYPASRAAGNPLSDILDPVHFIRAIEEKRLIKLEEAYPSIDKITSQIIFPLVSEKVVIGIFIDITEERRQQAQLDEVKEQTIRRAREVIEKQMMVAQEIAGLLGETTAETKILLSKLIKLMQEQN